MGISDSKHYSSSSFPISTSARDSLTGSMSLQMGTASRSRLLTLFLKMLFGRSHIVGFFRLHFPVQVEIGSIMF